MRRTIIKNANIISEGKIFESDILIEDFFISKISKSISPNFPNTKIIDASMIFVFGKLGLIDLEIFEIKKSSIKISDSNIFPSLIIFAFLIIVLLIF